MTIRILKTYYIKFGGFKAIRFFSKRKLIWLMTKKVLSNPFSRHSYMNAYLLAVRDVELFLIVKFSPMMSSRKAFYSGQLLEHKRSKIIWFCWLQGLENAPQIIKICYTSLEKHMSDREIKIIDDNNWNEYVELPEYIVSTWKHKKMAPAHFTDLLRLQLLIKYGGTWIDATVFCTGITPQNELETKSFLDADLFMFQYTIPDSKQWGGIGNWFITACSNNVVLLVLRDMLFAYWKEYDYIIDYYIFHLFFSMLRDVYPAEISSMPYGYAPRSLALVHHWEGQFDEYKWEMLTSRVCFHKLTYSVRGNVEKINNNYYHYVMRGRV